MRMRISKNIKDRLLDALITAFVFAASLTWKDTLVQIIDHSLPGDSGSIWAELIVAAAVTLIVILLVYLLIKSDQAAESHTGIFTENTNKSAREK